MSAEPQFELTVETPDRFDVHESTGWWITTIDDRGNLTCRADDDEDLCEGQHVYAAGNWRSAHVTRAGASNPTKPDAQVPPPFTSKQVQALRDALMGASR